MQPKQNNNNVLLTFFAVAATSNAVFDQPENGISNATTSGFQSLIRCAIVSALKPTRYLVSSSSKRFSQPSVGASMMLTACFLFENRRNRSHDNGWKNVGFSPCFRLNSRWIYEANTHQEALLTQKYRSGSIKTLH